MCKVDTPIIKKWMRYPAGLALVEDPGPRERIHFVIIGVSILHIPMCRLVTTPLFNNFFLNMLCCSLNVVIDSAAYYVQ